MRRRKTGAKAVRRARRRARQQELTRRARLGILVFGAMIALLVVTIRSLDAAHPEPRDMDHTGHVVPHEHYEGLPRAHEGYRQAAEIPNVLHGLYCYCRCSQHAGHYSLLDCFTSDHAARCDVCLSEAAIAYRMATEGEPLKDIRAAVDALY